MIIIKKENEEDLEWSWELFRHKVSIIEKEFIRKNKDKYNNFFDLEKALNQKLRSILEPEKNRLIELQLKSK